MRISATGIKRRGLCSNQSQLYLFTSNNGPSKIGWNRTSQERDHWKAPLAFRPDFPLFLLANEQPSSLALGNLVCIGWYVRITYSIDRLTDSTRLIKCSRWPDDIENEIRSVVSIHAQKFIAIFCDHKYDWNFYLMDDRE